MVVFPTRDAVECLLHLTYQSRDMPPHVPREELETVIHLNFRVFSMTDHNHQQTTQCYYH